MALRSRSANRLPFPRAVAAAIKMKLRSKTVRRPSKAATENRALNQRAAGRRHAPAPPVAGQGRRSQRGSREQPQEEQEEQQPSPPQPALPPPSQPAVDDEIAVALLQLALPTLQLEALDGLQQQQQQQPSAPDALPPPPAPTCDAEAARWLAANQLSPLLDLGVLRRGLASPDSAASCWPAAAGTPQLLGPAASLGSAARVQAPLLSFSAARLPAALYFGEPSGLREPGLGNPSATKRMRFDAVGRPPPASGAAEAAGLYALSAVPISPLQAKSTHQQPKPVCVEERSLFYAAASQVPFEIPAVAWGRPQSAAAAAVAAAAAAAAPSGSAPSMASWVLERGPTPLSHQSAATGYSPEAVSPEAGLSCDRSRRERRQRKVDASFDTWSDEDEEKQGGRGQEEEDYSWCAEYCWVQGR